MTGLSGSRRVTGFSLHPGDSCRTQRKPLQQWRLHLHRRRRRYPMSHHSRDPNLSLEPFTISRIEGHPSSAKRGKYSTRPATAISSSGSTGCSRYVASRLTSTRPGSCLVAHWPSLSSMVVRPASSTSSSSLSYSTALSPLRLQNSLPVCQPRAACTIGHR
jgi:hypothetical protein